MAVCSTPSSEHQTTLPPGHHHDQRFHIIGIFDRWWCCFYSKQSDGWWVVCFLLSLEVDTVSMEHSSADAWQHGDVNCYAFSYKIVFCKNVDVIQKCSPHYRGHFCPGDVASCALWGYEGYSSPALSEWKVKKEKVMTWVKSEWSCQLQILPKLAMLTQSLQRPGTRRMWIGPVFCWVTDHSWWWDTSSLSGLRNITVQLRMIRGGEHLIWECEMWVRQHTPSATGQEDPFCF